MMKVWLLLVVVSAVSGLAKASGCSEVVWTNAGSLRLPHSTACSLYSFLFEVEEGTTLVIGMLSTIEDSDILVKQRARNGSLLVTNRIQRERTRPLRITAPTVQAELIVPSSQAAFHAEYKLLRRAPTLSASTEGCRVRNPAVRITCNEKPCTFTCNDPEFIPASKSRESVKCRSPGWRHAVDHLCMARKNLKDLCFGTDGESIRCEFEVEDFFKFFRLEEMEAANGNPPPLGPRVLGVHGGGSSRHKTKRARFKDYVCKRRRDNGSYKFKCNKLVGLAVKKKCIYWRYLSSFCKRNGVF